MHLPSLLLLAACQDPDAIGLVELTPEIAVAPESLDFGDLGVPLTATDTVFVRNAGRATLELTAALSDDDAFSLDVTEATIEPGEGIDLAVRFHPTTYLRYETNLVFTSNDADTPELIVPLAGTGVAAPLPDIYVERQTVDFGEVATSRQEIVAVQNVGTAPLRLGAARLSGSGAFRLVLDPSGTTIAAGDTLPVLVEYTPPHTDGDSAILTLPSDDPDEPDTAVILLGNGGADYPYPEAVIDCPPTTVPPAFVPLDGYDSTDPAGHLPLSYEWSLVRLPADPFGNPTSSAYLTNAVSASTQLFADAIGTYEVQLVVTNTLGTRSAPARCAVDGIPTEGIVVELTWSTANADLDLHLSRNSAPIFSRPDSASWCNRSPDWAPAGGSGDPRLDLDDRSGHGPENMKVEFPADGTYDVRVHYFEDQGDDVVEATVRVYTLGSILPAFQATRELRRNDVWDAARVNWPDGTVGALSAEPYASPTRRCYTP